MPASKTGVAVVEDQREIREGLRVLIDGTPGFRCTGAYGSMEEALTGIETTRPDIAIVDIGLPGMSGIAGIERLKEISERARRTPGANDEKRGKRL